MIFLHQLKLSSAPDTAIIARLALRQTKHLAWTSTTTNLVPRQLGLHQLHHHSRPRQNAGPHVSRPLSPARRRSCLLQS